MIEGLFVITTIFISYVVYQVVNEPKATNTSDEPQAVAETPSAPEPAVVAAEPAAPVVEPVKEAPAAKKATAAKTEPAAPVVEAVKEAPAAKKAATAKAEPAVEPAPAAPVAEATTEPAAEVKAEAPAAEEAPAAAENAAPKPAGIKNPKTGEVVIVYNNYRFAKRWIKEALVSEGLLKKIYKNNELNADVEAKIKEAIAKLEGMDKYRV